MAYITTNLGEEFITKNGLDAVTFDFGLYSDSTDTVTDTDDLAAITTEPTGAAYARQSDPLSAADISGDWGGDNDNQISFDTSDSSQTVDGVFMVANFQATETGDSSANDHLIATAALSQSRDLSQIDTFNIAAGDAGITLD